MRGVIGTRNEKKPKAMRAAARRKRQRVRRHARERKEVQALLRIVVHDCAKRVPMQKPAARMGGRLVRESAKWLAFAAPREGTPHDRVRISLPAHDPLCSVHEERRVLTDSVAEHLPDSARGLRIHKAYHDAIPMARACRSNPLGHAQELRLDVLGILVDLLRVHLLADPRSFQERLAVGSVVEAGEHRRHDLDENRLHVPLPVADLARLMKDLIRPGRSKPPRCKAVRDARCEAY
jgi:hypothetical protein